MNKPQFLKVTHIIQEEGRFCNTEIYGGGEAFELVKLATRASIQPSKALFIYSRCHF